MTAPKTYGLTHLALVVKDIEASIRFYNIVFETRTMYHNDGFAQIQTIGSNDIIVFEEKKEKKNDIGKTGGLLHFGFRLKNAKDIDEMERRIIKAGGIILDKGEFVPGEPYIFFKDPDGYDIEVWYELEQ
jgi:predicted enzyme related to lactoylglutathione lyase